MSPASAGRAQPADVSVIIPTLNEAVALPILLDSLKAQTVQPCEILVVDANSEDATASVAEGAGARVIPDGGRPGFSRNLGAKQAVGEWLLFLDADVRLPQDALEVAMHAMKTRRLGSASCAFEPDSKKWLIRLHHRLSSDYFWLSSHLRWVHSIGAFLLVRRALHEQIGGFDHTVIVAEDQDYVRRLARADRYAYLRKPVVEIAVRRFSDEGFVKMSAKWLGIELHRLFLGEIRGDYFKYFK